MSSRFFYPLRLVCGTLLLCFFALTPREAEADTDVTVDDTRDSPALRIAGLLADQGADVRAYDPAVKGPIQGLEPAADPYSVCDAADVLVVLTEWDEFRWLDFDKVAGLMAAPRVVDARNLLDKPALERRGFSYVGIGR